jgi:arylsulfatase A-like enzyme
LYWEFHEDGGRQATRMDNWKGVRLNVKKDQDAPIQLFDLTTDPKESKDISAAHPEIVKEINRIMKEEHVEVEAFPFLK